MIWLLSLLRTTLGIGGSINGMLVAAIAGITAFLGYTAYVHHLGKKSAGVEIGKQIEKGATDAGDKSDKEHVAAAKPGAFDRLRADARTCPDCVKDRDGKPVQKLAAPENKKQ